MYSDYNDGTNFLSINNIHLVQDNFPNLTVSVIPINELKANYFIQQGKYNEAIELLSKKNLNPYLGFRDNLLVQSYIGLKESDSVFKYIKKSI